MNGGISFKGKLLVLAGALVLVIVVAVLLSRDSTTTENTAQTPGQTANGNTANSGTDETPVTYEGFKELASRGMTSFQMQGLRYALFQFAPEANKFKVTPSSIKTSAYDRDRPQAIVPVTFNISIDDKPYLAKVDKYNDLTTIRVYLYDSQDKQVFDSKPVDSRKVDAAETAPGE